MPLLELRPTGIAAHKKTRKLIHLLEKTGIGRDPRPTQSV
jgi:hypothetical protein